MTRTRAIKIIGITLGLLVLATEFQACLWTRNHARQVALRRVTDYCVSTGRDPQLLIAGKEQTFGNAIWSFDWTYQGQPRHFIGAWIARDGHVELILGDPDDSNSAAYEPR
jgi:hypothetical protein